MSINLFQIKSWCVRTVRWWLVGRSIELNMHCGDVWALHLSSCKTGAAAVQYLAADRRELPAFAHVKVPGLQQLSAALTMTWPRCWQHSDPFVQRRVCWGARGAWPGACKLDAFQTTLFGSHRQNHLEMETTGTVNYKPEDGSEKRVDFNLNGNTRGF